MGPMMEVPSWNSRDVHDNHENLVDWLRDTVKGSKHMSLTNLYAMLFPNIRFPRWGSILISLE